MPWDGCHPELLWPWLLCGSKVRRVTLPFPPCWVSDGYRQGLPRGPCVWVPVLACPRFVILGKLFNLAVPQFKYKDYATLLPSLTTACGSH